MPVDVSVILSRLATSWGLLTHSVNQVVQAGRGDSHRLHLQTNEVAYFENVYRLVRPNISPDIRCKAGKLGVNQRYVSWRILLNARRAFNNSDRCVLD